MKPGQSQELLDLVLTNACVCLCAVIKCAYPSRVLQLNCLQKVSQQCCLAVYMLDGEGKRIGAEYLLHLLRSELTEAAKPDLLIASV